MRILYIALLLLAIAGPAHAATYTAATCSLADVQTAFNNESATPANGDIIAIPSCSATLWNGTINFSTAVSLTIQGNTTVSCTGTPGTSTFACTPTDNTIIEDGRTTGQNNPLLDVTLTGSSGQVVRITGLTINGGGITTYHGELQYGGSVVGTQVRFDHNHVTNYYIPGIEINQPGADGVIDHNVFDNPGGMTANAIRVFRGDEGNIPWNAATPFGTANMTYIEDDVIDGSFVNDCMDGASFVFRYSTLNAAGNNAVQSHATGSGGWRGCRSWIVDNDYFTNSAANGSTAEFWGGSGTGLSYANTVVNTGAGSWTNEFQIFHDRDELTTNYQQQQIPNGWSVCGPGNTPVTGTVSTSGTAVTSGSALFSTSWLSGTQVIIGPISGQTNYSLSSVASTTSLTLGASAGTQTNVPFSAGSPWDANSGLNSSQGGPCIDQFGRGQGDLLADSGYWPSLYDTNLSSGAMAWRINNAGSGYVVGDVLTIQQTGSGNNATITVEGVNGGGAVQSYPAPVVAEGTGYVAGTGLSVTGGHGTGATFDALCCIGWPHQDLEPGYWIDESLGPGIGIGFVNSGGNNEQANRDYYVPAGGGGGSIQTSPTTPFNGASDTGFGTLANRPTTCTPGQGGTYYTSPGGAGSSLGVAYMETDHGDQIDYCYALNTWSTKTSSPASYVPYTYPHPLDTTTSQASDPSCTPTSGVVPQTVTCTNPNTGTTVMCYNTTGAPATNGLGTACNTGTAYSGPISVASAETLYVIAGTSTLSDSNVVQYTYTAGGVNLGPPSPILSAENVAAYLFGAPLP